MAKMTDDNDNLVDIPDTDEEEWIKTEGGYVRSTIPIDTKIITDLVDLWVVENLRPESLEQYKEMNATGDQREALYAAVVNDQIIAALTLAIDLEKENDTD